MKEPSLRKKRTERLRRLASKIARRRHALRSRVERGTATSKDLRHLEEAHVALDALVGYAPCCRRAA